MYTEPAVIEMAKKLLACTSSQHPLRLRGVRTKGHPATGQKATPLSNYVIWAI